MVGVPGKYRGCETCRLRRVKCDNERPFCKKCIDTGRECAGYEREPVFIIGTLEDGGRCSSHPPRKITPKQKKAAASKSSGKKSTAAASSSAAERPELLPVQPVQPGWDDLISLSSAGTMHQVQVAALYTPLRMVARQHEEGDTGGRFAVSFQSYIPADVRPLGGDDDFHLQSQCMVHLAPADASQSPDPEATSTDSICLFLYEHNSDVVLSSLPPWKDPSIQGNSVRQLGPEHFRVFPAHHFFVRIYRQNAICAALLNRKSTFLSGQEWITAPWETHPKSWFDKLLDQVVLLPSILSRADRIIPHDPTVARRLLAQDLLGNCLNAERLLEAWFLSVNPPLLDAEQPVAFWIEDPEASDAQIPFADTFAFRDSVTAVMFIYYWTSLILFYPCIESLHEAIFQPVVDAYPQVYPTLAPNLQINQHKYGIKMVRELAANVCRSLDFALSTTVQPDLLVFPLHVVGEFYKAINTSSGDGALELMWCDAFRARLTSRGQDIADVIQSRSWVELGRY